MKLKKFYVTGYFVCWVMIGVVVAAPSLMTGMSDRETTLAVLFATIPTMAVAYFTQRWWILHWILIGPGLLVSVVGFIESRYLFIEGAIYGFIALYFAIIALFVLGAGIFGWLACREQDGT